MRHLRSSVWLLWVMGVWLNAIDIILTSAVIKDQGSLGEFNPIMRLAIEHWGWAGLLSIKAALFMFVSWLIAIIHHTKVGRAQHMLFIALAATDALMFINVVWGAYCANLLSLWWVYS